ncbi:tetratricopeptide repeat protein [Myxococcaceae bacterium GXIMD 01537]
MASSQARANDFQGKLSEGRALLANGSSAQALAAFQAASALAPDQPEPQLLIAEVHRQAGRYGSAILALKQAEALAPGLDASIQKQLADVYRRDGHPAQAISTLQGLRDADQLTDPELLMLARLQARERDPEGAFQTLGAILRERPDDVEAKLVEAEILLLKGEELLAAKLMDRLIEQNPSLVAARLMRARYFLNSGFAQEAEKDLGRVAVADADRPEVVTLKARVLAALGRHEEAVAALTRAVEADPRDVESLSQLAEAKVLQEHYDEAQQLVDKALRLKPQFARALYVRGRVQEARGRVRDAEESYRYALTSDAGLAQVYSRLWRLHDEAGRKDEATGALEQLFFLGEATPEEKVALAAKYAEGKRQLERGRKLIEEALRREPGNERYLAIKDAIEKATPKVKPKNTGPVIIRGGR